MKNTNNNTTEKIADFEKNAMHNEASETSTVQAVAAKPSFWERCKQWMNEEVDRVKRDLQGLKLHRAWRRVASNCNAEKQSGVTAPCGWARPIGKRPSRAEREPREAEICLDV